MSAADLFNSPYDVEFRLKGTHIMIGRQPYYVRQAFPDGPKVEDTILQLQDPKDEDIQIKLGRLPLKTMTNCPHGWFDGVWYARGPARHRYQGITGSSLWCVLPSGNLEIGGVGNPSKLLKEMAIQPRIRRPGKRPSGALTRDVYIDKDRVKVRGITRGEYLGENLMKPLTEINPLTEILLNNAKIGIINTPTEELAKGYSMAHPEIIL